MEDSTNSKKSDTTDAKNSNYMTGTTSIEFEPNREQPAKIKVIGVGGGGGNAVNHMFHEGIHGVEFIVCNTDAKALKSSPVPNKIVLGELGAGNNPDHARKMALEHKEEIIQALSDDTQMLFITAGMGGGTGTGAAPVIAELAKSIKLSDEMVPSILVVAIVTEPFFFEGPIRTQQAAAGIEELKKHVDAILVINNDNLRRLGDMDIDQAFSKADDVLLTAAKGIAEIITMTGKVNIDFRDVNTVMQHSGTALMGAGEGRGENRALQAIESAATSVLLNNNDIRGAKNILLYFSYAPNHKITMDELYEVTEYIKDRTGHAANVIWGNGEDENLDDELRITLIATGFEPIPTTVIHELPIEKKEETPVSKTEETKAPAEKKESIEKVTVAEDNNDIHIVHKETVTTATVAAQTVDIPASESESANEGNNPFMPVADSNTKRYFHLDPMDEEKIASDESENESECETTCETENEATAKEENIDNEGTSHLSEIRIITKEVIEQTSNPKTSAPQFHINQNEYVAPAKPGNDTPSNHSEPCLAFTSPFQSATESYVGHTDAETATLDRPNPTTERIVSQQTSQAFNPAESVDDTKARERAERIKRINYLLKSVPEGPRQIEDLKTEELMGEPLYETRHSSESEAPKTRVNSDGTFVPYMNLLNDIPD